MRRTACILLLAAGCTVDGAPDLATSKDEASSLAVAIEWVTSSADIPHVSASSAKAVWVAAALDGVGIDPVAPYADPVFRVARRAMARRANRRDPRRDRLQLHGALTGCRACNGVDTVQRNIGVRARSAQLRARATTRRGTAVAGSSLHEADPPRRSPPRRRLRCRPGHRV
jgi:hypothetical protein